MRDILSPDFGNSLSTVALIVLVLMLRALVLKSVQRWKFPNNEMRRKWIVQARNVTILVILIGIILIWADELKEFAVSIVAVAVALVIATKEVSLCILGGFFKYSANLFTIGDRIEIGDIRGDIIDHNALTTTIYEIGPGKDMHQFTGRVVTIPNSMLLSMPIRNDTATGHYALHVFRIPFPRNSEWHGEAKKLLVAAQDVCADYIDKARAEFEKVARKEGLETPKIGPRLQIHYPDENRVDVVIRMPAPSRAKGRIEQAVLAQYSGLQT